MPARPRWNPSSRRRRASATAGVLVVAVLGMVAVRSSVGDGSLVPEAEAAPYGVPVTGETGAAPSATASRVRATGPAATAAPSRSTTSHPVTSATARTRSAVPSTGGTAIGSRSPGGRTPVSALPAPSTPPSPPQTSTQTPPQTPTTTPPSSAPTPSSPGSSGGNPSCPDVQVIWSRGTGVPLGLTGVGLGLVEATAALLPTATVTAYIVPYAASEDQRSAGPGATLLTQHLVAMASSCPSTRFVLGGYSQGATLTDIALGLDAGLTPGEAIPSSLASRVKAVVVFGNTLGHKAGETIATSGSPYGDRSKDFCNSVDPVCGAQPKTGVGDHTSYLSNGSTLLAARFVVAQLT